MSKQQEEEPVSVTEILGEDETKCIIRAISNLYRVGPEKAAFMREYLHTGRKIDAAVSVGIPPNQALKWADKVLESHAARPVVAAYQRALLQRSVISREWVLDRYLKLLDSDMADIKDKTNILKHITALMGFDAPQKHEIAAAEAHQPDDDQVEKMISAYQETKAMRLAVAKQQEIEDAQLLEQASPDREQGENGLSSEDGN